MASRQILVSAFEPSGDAVAAPLIVELKRRDPALEIFGLGGTRMAAAGAVMVEQTTEDAVIGVPPLKKIAEHRGRMQRLRAWMRSRDLAAVVPTDSPAANWGVCKLTRELSPRTPIVHLVAPQLWAWASWRIRKMRRLSDHALCLLPFEPDWFSSRGVPATFVGHPIFEEPTQARAARQRADDPTPWPDAPLKVALLPGSRPSEWAGNWSTLTAVARRVRADHPDAAFVLAAVSDRAAELAHTVDAGVIHPRVGQIDAVLDWADVVVAVSGTVTLQVANHRKPMVILYRVNRATWNLLGRWLISTRTFTLPNLIGEYLGLGRRVPELVPHFGNVEPVLDALAPLLRPGDARSRQFELFDAIHERYASVRFAERSADVVMRHVEGR